MKSIFQGNQAHFSPLYIQPLPVPPTKTAHYVFGLQKVSSQVISQELSLIHGIPMQDDDLTAATWLNTSELALLAGLPSREIPGIRLRKNVDFAVNAINPDMMLTNLQSVSISNSMSMPLARSKI